MNQTTSPLGSSGVFAPAERSSYGALLSKTMSLVAIALGFAALGAYLSSNMNGGEGMAQAPAVACMFGAMGVLFAQGFVQGLQRGPVGLTVMFFAALLLGLGIGPAIASYIDFKPDAVYKAAVTTALIVTGAGAAGSLTAKDLSPVMRPLSFILLGAIGVSWAMFFFKSGDGLAGNIVSLIIGAASAVGIMVYFNVLKNRATDDDVIWIATSIFVGIINIFLSLLNLFGRD